MPIKPGQSGNPGGRPNVALLFLDATQSCEQVVGTLVHLMLHSRRDSVRLDAATYIADRIWGKPLQGHIVSTDSAFRAQLDALPEGMLRALIAGATIEGEATLLPDVTPDVTGHNT